MSLSVLVLERPGRWRLAGLSFVIAVSLLPTLPLILAIRENAPWATLNVPGFLPLLIKSLAISFSGAAAALVLGLCKGVFFSLYEYRAKRLFLFLFIIPIMVPPLLWSVSFNNLSFYFRLISMHKTVCLVFITAMVTLPLVAASTVSACQTLTSSQCEAVRLTAGETRLFWLCLRFAFPPAAVAACLGAFGMLASPGPAMGLGLKTAISEILVSFSALYDMKLASAQCVMLSASTLALASFVLLVSGKRPMELLASSSKRLQPSFQGKMSTLAFVFSLLCSVLLVLIPCGALLFPAFTLPDVSLLARTLSRTLPYSLLYSAGSALVALFLGFALAFFMGRFNLTRTIGMSAMLVIFSLPPSLTALGFVYSAAQAPPWLDFIFRSPISVCMAQGFRLFPVPALLAARYFASLPPSWAYAAEIQDISLKRFSFKVLSPLACKTLLTGFLLVFLLSGADVATVLLIHPPGGQNLPLAIFTIMANAPRGQVAQLCSLYLALATIFLASISAIWNRGKTWKSYQASY